VKIKIIFCIIYLFIKDEIKNFLIIFSLISSKIRTNKKIEDKKYDFFTKFQKFDISKKKILITTFLGIYDYLKYEYLIAVYLSNIKKRNITVLIEENDNISKNFFLKKGINSFIYYKSKPNFFLRIGYLIKAYNLICNINNIKNFVNFKYENLPTGKMIYSHVCRFTRTPTFERVEYKFYNTLANYLHFATEFKKIIKQNSFKYFIQAETQFIPPAVFMGYSLKKKIMMISRIGNDQKISVRQTNNLKHFNESRWKYDKSFFNIIKKKYKNEAILAGSKILNDRFKGLNAPDKDIDIEGIKLSKIKKIKFLENYDKKYICNYFNWDISKPIGVIFANDLTDGLFCCTWGIHRDNYIWLKEIINYASKNKNINWLVKSHPSDFKNEGKLKTKNLFENNLYPENIKFFPENWGRKKLHKIVDIIFTNYGSAGYEYPAMGIPAVISSESNYYGLNIAYETHTDKELKKMVMKSHKIKKLNKKISDNAKMFIFLESIFTKTKIHLATLDHSYEDTNSENYWNEYFKNFKKTSVYKLNSFKKDEFYKVFQHQIKNNLKHNINKNYI